MRHDLLRAKKTFLISAAILVPITLLLGLAGAQTPPNKTAMPNDARSPVQTNVATSVQLELVRTETGFFEAWKSKDQAYFRDHMPENGVVWGETGTFSRDEQLAEQQASAKTCTVQGYGLSEFGVLPLAGGVYLLTYKAEQYATCNGERLQVHINGSSIYVSRAGRWQAIYRAQVPLKNQS
jgi:hypothetical protein